MQERVRYSFRHFGLLALATITAPVACQDGPLSDDEMTRLRAFALPSALPSDPSNWVADSPDAARLGQQLYFDPRYAGDLLPAYNSVAGQNGALGVAPAPGSVSCASCHDPGTAGMDRRSKPNATSLGAGYTGRNAPTVINAAYSPIWQFWDGRADSLWSQALGPPEGGVECNGSRLAVAHLIFDHYRQDYDAIFSTTDPPQTLPADMTAFPLTGKPGDLSYDSLSPDDRTIVDQIYANFGKLIAAYERQLISAAFQPSAFDRFLNGETDALSPAAIRGARLFVGRAGCAECHTGSMFTDYGFHNIGAPQTGEFVPATDRGRFDMGDLNSSMFNRKGLFSDDRNNPQPHLEALTTTPPDSTKGQFKTPSLRNVSKTAPYMHDGVYQTLWDVVNHYNFGGSSGTYTGDKDPAIAPLLLSDAELSDLVEFLRALDDGDALDPALVTRPHIPDLPDPP
jgi:cytochrome c peroxidase